MMDWSIEIGWLPEEDDETRVDDRSIEVLAKEIQEYAGAVSWGHQSYSIRLSVEAPEVGKAVDVALGIGQDAVARAGLPQWPIGSVLVQSYEVLDRELSTPLYPSIVGVTELAEMLDVSKQRASELARVPSFPAPFTELASGPVWIEDNVSEFCRTWVRKPGRPRRPNDLDEEPKSTVELMDDLKKSVADARRKSHRDTA